MAGPIFCSQPMCPPVLVQRVYMTPLGGSIWRYYRPIGLCKRGSSSATAVWMNLWTA